MYATKRRRRNSKSVRVQPKDGQTKSNPSKRHRERLNAELDLLASLLPYEQSVLSKLDKLSILRLSVSYLRTKSYFQAVFQKEREKQANIHDIGMHKATPRELIYPEMMMEGDLILQALNGFLLILTCDGEVFYTSHTVETYLGFHQSDICHQSVYELVHSEDREELQRHLMWNSNLPNDRSNLRVQEAFLPENLQCLERNFTVRFRCLLDNTSGFMRLDIRGRIKLLHGQNHKSEEAPLALFAVCTPFGPPSLLEMPQKDSTFKSYHKLDLELTSLDQRGKQLLGYTDAELSNKKVYDLVHFDDLAYVASAHQELLKTGASGLVAYRLLCKDNKWQWLQTSALLKYKFSKPDSIFCNHRPLMEEEGRDLLGKRTMDFKVTYLDGGLGNMNDRSGLLSDSEFVLRCQRNRRYKSQIRDIITNCRSSSKRKPLSSSDEYTPFAEMPGPGVVSVAAAAASMASAHAAMSANPAPYGPPSAAVYHYTDNMNSLSPYTMQQNLFTAAMDHGSRSFLAPENFFHYSRHALSSYYPEYHHHTVSQYTNNGFLDHRTSARTAHCFENDKLYGCQLGSSSELKYNGADNVSAGRPLAVKSCCDGYINPTGSLMGGSSGIQPLITESKLSASDMNCHRNPLNFGLTSSTSNDLGISVIKHKTSLPALTSSPPCSSSLPLETALNATSSSAPSIGPSSSHSVSNDQCSRSSGVLMWTAAANLNRVLTSSSSKHPTSPSSSTPTLSDTHKSSPVVSCKWNGTVTSAKPLSPHPSMANSPSSAKVPMTIPPYGPPSSYATTTDMSPIEGWNVDNISQWRSHLPTLG